MTNTLEPSNAHSKHGHPRVVDYLRDAVMVTGTRAPTHGHPVAFGRLAAAIAIAASVVACDGAEDPLDSNLAPNTNVVEESPTPFAPVQGGMGQGVYESVPYSYFVLTESVLEDVGETRCGQFQYQASDLRVELYGTLTPGTWNVVAASAVLPQEGDAHIEFANGGWSSGTVTIDEGSEERGTTVRGSLDVVTDDAERLAMTFQVLFHGCGFD